MIFGLDFLVLYFTCLKYEHSLDVDKNTSYASL